MLDLSHIAKRHKEWLKIATYLGCTGDESDEVVQRMYLKLGELQNKEGNLNRLLNYNEQINTVYIFKVLQNLVIDFKKKDNLIQYQEQIENTECSTDESSEEEYQLLIVAVKSCLTQFHEYDQMLIEMHFVYGLSMRQISKETGIPTHSIFNSIKNAKTRIRQSTKQVHQNYVRAEQDKKAFNGLGRHDREDNRGDGD
jgi:RNA polymerase sigma factor (sigma-70 family)